MTVDAFEFVVRGPNATEVARELHAALVPLAPETSIRSEELPSPAGADRGGAELGVAISALIVSIPSAWLAVQDLIARREQRKAAERVRVCAQQVFEVHGQVTTVTLRDGRLLHVLDTDELLRLVCALDAAPQHLGGAVGHEDR